MPRSELSNQGLDGCHNVEEKRAKREIANMNERRRMQNINSGFHSLRALLPQKHDGEKLSKAAILQHTSSYIYQLEQEITKLLNQNSELKRVVGGADGGAVTNTNTPDWIKRLGSQPPDCPSCKRRKYETNNKQEIDFSPLGADGSSTESSSEQEISAKQRTRMHKSSDSSSIRNQLARLERQLEEERRIRALLEEELNCQGKLSSVNGRQYQTAIDHSMPSDEVEIASESIEIEMHSCPASPPDVMSIASVATAGNEHVLSTGPVYLTNQLVGTNNNSNKMMESARHHPRVHQKQQNAIALPIDVPFVAPRDLSMDGGGLVDNCRTVKTGNSADGSNGSLVVVVDSNGVLSLIDPSKIHHQTTSKTNSLATTTTTTNASNIQLSHQILQLIPNGGVNAKAPAINNHHHQQQQHHNNNNNNNNNKSQQNSSNESNNNHNNNNNNNNNSQKASSPDSAKTSRQNLNTIVEAIRHLEGEHMFNHIFNEKESKESPMTIDNNNKQQQSQQQQTYSQSQENNNNNNNKTCSSDIKSSNSSIDIKTESNNNDNCLETTTATDLSKNNSNSNNNIDSQQRPQIIQIQQRPNVIVSNSGVES